MSRASPVQDPRIAKKEMIITRFKSAQQKKQQNHKQSADKQSYTKVLHVSKTAQNPTTNTKALLSVSKTAHNPTTTTKVLLNVSKTAQNVLKSTLIRTKSPQTVTKAPETKSKAPETVTKLSQTVKSVATKSKSSKKGIPKKSIIKEKDQRQEIKSPILIEDDNLEYYPDKPKRAPGTRKVFLKPKQKSTMIARTNKRKFNTPKRGVQSSSPDVKTPKCRSPVYADLSMAEVIRIVEENDSLDDEDLMEILTCPSPVWWEEPPGDMYVEEAICSRNPEENAEGKTKSPIRERCMNTLRNSIKVGHKIITQVSNIDSNNKTECKKDEKFVKKSKKLENVLGIIKNKVRKDSDTSGQDKHSEKTDIYNVSENSEPKSDEKSCNIDSIASNADVIKETDKNKLKTNVDVEITESKHIIKAEDETHEHKIKNLSESTEESLDLNNELLLDLQNIEIPIRDSGDLNSPDCVIINDDNSNKIIDVDELDCTNCDNTEIKNDGNASNKETIKTELQKSNSNVIDVVSEASAVPKTLPPLIKCPKIENAVFLSPNSYKSISDDVTESSSVSGVDGMDTISDTNIKFITDDDLDEVSDKNKEDGASLDKEFDTKDTINKNNENMTELNEIAVINNSTDTKSKESYITVYKIVPNDDAKPKNKFKNIPEYSNHVENLIQSETKPEITDESLENDIPDIPIDTKGQLNSFFKKCKNANRKRKRLEVQDRMDERETCKSPKKSITVAQDENVKYCMKCSSIFDTEDCSYCLKTQKSVDNVETDKSFMCDKCDFVGESKNNVSLHLEEHVMDEESKT